MHLSSARLTLFYFVFINFPFTNIKKPVRSFSFQPSTCRVTKRLQLELKHSKLQNFNNFNEILYWGNLIWAASKSPSFLYFNAFCLRPSGSETYKLACDSVTPSVRFVETLTLQQF